MGIFNSYVDKCPRCKKDILYDGGLEVGKHECKPLTEKQLSDIKKYEDKIKKILTFNK